MTRDRARLELVCCHSTLETNLAVIRGSAAELSAVKAAHRRRSEAKDESMLAWVTLDRSDA